MTSIATPEKTPEQQRQDRINAREQATEQAREARQTERQTWRDGRKAAVEQRKETIKENNAEKRLMKEDRELDREVFVSNGFDTRAIKQRDLALNTSDRTNREIIACDFGIQANQNVKQRVAQQQQNISQKLSTISSRQSTTTNEIQQKQVRLNNLPNVPENSRERQRLQTELQRLNTRASSLANAQAALTTRAQSLAQKQNALDTSASNLTAKKQKAVADQQASLKRALEKEDESAKQKEIKKIAQDRKEVPKENRKDCICPAVYDPVVVNGKTYSNSCWAACAGQTVPPNPPKPQPPQNRVCLQVITCGSDGNTYPNSCLPVGVYPVRRGGSCDGLSIDPAIYKHPSTRPAVLIGNQPISYMV